MTLSCMQRTIRGNVPAQPWKQGTGRSRVWRCRVASSPNWTCQVPSNNFSSHVRDIILLLHVADAAATYDAQLS